VIPEKDTTLDTRDITEFCRRKLAQVKVPSQIRLMDELPRGSYGKVKKEILKTL
jgi:Acyl-CoA synthetases (AMP-forming)/AMP-acid ligases II